MKLLFDENLSPRLIDILRYEYPDSSHVHLVGLGSSDDVAIWDYARANEYVLVSKDGDYFEMSILQGAPPKFVWVRRGNCSTRMIADLLVRHRPDVETLCSRDDYSFLVVE